MPSTRALEGPPETAILPPSAPLVAQVQTLLFVSGFSALLLEVVYVKLLRYWAGNTAYAVAAVLCAYMAGLAAGSFAAGKWLVRWRPLLALYGSMELLVGLYSVSLPWLMAQFKPPYLKLTFRMGPDTNLALLGHFTMAVTLLLLPTLLMGATYPVVVRAASQAVADRTDVAEKLYYANLAGAALGTLLSDFLLIRFWGLGNTLILVAVINASVAACAMVLQSRQQAPAPVTKKAGEMTPTGGGGSRVILLVAFCGGFLVLFLELVWTNMVGRFLDSTVYGFAVTLFAVIAGLGVGAAIVTRQLATRAASDLLPRACLGAGLMVTALIPFWDGSRLMAEEHPAWCVAFAVALVGALVLAVDARAKTASWYIGVSLGLVFAILCRRWLDPQGTEFWVLHGVDFSVSALFMVGPAALMGMIFPLVLRWYLAEARSASQSVAPVYALNTLGCLAGILVATFLVLPRVGVERSGRAVGLGFFALGLVLLGRRLTRWRWAVALAMLPALAWSHYLRPWDFSQTLHFLDHSGEVVYAREDLNAGLTTVLRDGNDRNIFVNDLFNGGTSWEQRDQARIALVPLLYTHEFERTMVIGVGTGQTAGIMGQYPFTAIDVVDFSPRVMEAAEEFFPDINFRIFKDPRVKVHVADGRHYLLTHPAKLSLLTIEVNRLYTAGEGDLYTREFYEVCSARLTDHGVMQQWVPLFSLSIPETLIIARTVRQVFPYVALYVGGGSGMLVASRSPLELDYARFREIDANPKVAAVLRGIELPRAVSLLGDLVLVPQGLDALLARASERRISTDLWPYLEHSNARYHVGNPSSMELWHFLLTAEEFQIPPVAGADQAAMTEIRKYAREERQSQLEGLADH
jgi:spermidine synthase